MASLISGGRNRVLPAPDLDLAVEAPPDSDGVEEKPVESKGEAWTEEKQPVSISVGAGGAQRGAGGGAAGEAGEAENGGGGGRGGATRPINTVVVGGKAFEDRRHGAAVADPGSKPESYVPVDFARRPIHQLDAQLSKIKLTHAQELRALNTHHTSLLESTKAYYVHFIGEVRRAANSQMGREKVLFEKLTSEFRAYKKDAAEAISGVQEEKRVLKLAKEEAAEEAEKQLSEKNQQLTEDHDRMAKEKAEELQKMHQTDEIQMVSRMAAAGAMAKGMNDMTTHQLEAVREAKAKEDVELEDLRKIVEDLRASQAAGDAAGEAGATELGANVATLTTEVESQATRIKLLLAQLEASQAAVAARGGAVGDDGDNMFANAGGGGGDESMPGGAGAVRAGGGEVAGAMAAPGVPLSTQGSEQKKVGGAAAGSAGSPEELAAAEAAATEATVAVEASRKQVSDLVLEADRMDKEIAAVAEEGAAATAAAESKSSELDEMSAERKKSKATIKKWLSDFEAENGHAATKADKAAVKHLYVRHRDLDSALKRLQEELVAGKAAKAELEAQLAKAKQETEEAHSRLDLANAKLDSNIVQAEDAAATVVAVASGRGAGEARAGTAAAAAPTSVAVAGAAGAPMAVGGVTAVAVADGVAASPANDVRCAELQGQVEALQAELAEMVESMEGASGEAEEAQRAGETLAEEALDAGRDATKAMDNAVDDIGARLEAAKASVAEVEAKHQESEDGRNEVATLLQAAIDKGRELWSAGKKDQCHAEYSGAATQAIARLPAGPEKEAIEAAVAAAKAKTPSRGAVTIRKAFDTTLKILQADAADGDERLEAAKSEALEKAEGLDGALQEAVTARDAAVAQVSQLEEQLVELRQRAVESKEHRKETLEKHKAVLNSGSGAGRGARSKQGRSGRGSGSSGGGSGGGGGGADVEALNRADARAEEAERRVEELEGELHDLQDGMESGMESGGGAKSGGKGGSKGGAGGGDALKKLQNKTKEDRVKIRKLEKELEAEKRLASSGGGGGGDSKVLTRKLAEAEKKTKKAVAEAEKKAASAAKGMTRELAKMTKAKEAMEIDLEGALTSRYKYNGTQCVGYTCVDAPSLFAPAFVSRVHTSLVPCSGARFPSSHPYSYPMCLSFLYPFPSHSLLFLTISLNPLSYPCPFRIFILLPNPCISPSPCPLLALCLLSPSRLTPPPASPPLPVPSSPSRLPPPPPPSPSPSLCRSRDDGQGPSEGRGPRPGRYEGGDGGSPRQGRRGGGGA
jgi:uncharacterized membrane protein YgcG